MRTAVALSGGIDSMMAAFLLKREGADIIGIHFLTGYEAIRHPRDTEPENVDLQRHPVHAIADQLAIPMHIVDFRTIFRKQVTDYFVHTYMSGKTPNPCMVCNERIKFGVLLDEAKKLGAGCLATGHYARIAKSGGRFRLLRGIDQDKDQSYFLALLSQAQLGRARFPLGGMTKDQVRRLARENGLQPLSKCESQDICFIPDGSYAGFLESESCLPQEKGPIVDSRGNLLGEHHGLHHYTIGQRRGINCPAPAPYYVLQIDVPRNRLVVGAENELYSDKCYISDINWIAPQPEGPVHVHTRIRYRHLAAESVLVPLGGGKARIEFKNPQAAITPGQAAVCYQEDEVVAAGWIDHPAELQDS